MGRPCDVSKLTVYGHRKVTQTRQGVVAYTCNLANVRLNSGPGKPIDSTRIAWKGRGNMPVARWCSELWPYGTLIFVSKMDLHYLETCIRDRAIYLPTNWKL